MSEHRTAIGVEVECSEALARKLGACFQIGTRSIYGLNWSDGRLWWVAVFGREDRAS